MNPEERLALRTIRSELSTRLSGLAGTLWSFEHGGAFGSMVSCSVDQAHLHLVPLDFDLAQKACEYDMGWSSAVSINELTEADTYGREYLFVERNGFSLVGFPQAPTSQWFRQLIAQECGVMEWDYKKNPNLEQLKETVEMLVRPTRSIVAMRS
jgi:hypothetical protein